MIDVTAIPLGWPVNIVDSLPLLVSEASFPAASVFKAKKEAALVEISFVASCKVGNLFWGWDPLFVGGGTT